MGAPGAGPHAGDRQDQRDLLHLVGEQADVAHPEGVLEGGEHGAVAVDDLGPQLVVHAGVLEGHLDHQPDHEAEGRRELLAVQAGHRAGRDEQEAVAHLGEVAQHSGAQIKHAVDTLWRSGTGTGPRTDPDEARAWEPARPVRGRGPSLGREPRSIRARVRGSAARACSVAAAQQPDELVDQLPGPP